MKKKLEEYRKKHGLCDGNLKCDCNKILIEWARNEIQEYQEFIKMLQKK